MRPITGTAIGRMLLLSSSEATPVLARTRPRSPSITLGVKPRERPPLMPCATESGSLMTSMARARFGKRRMKPRSSNAVIRRWMPDLDRRSRASFISSKEGGTPDSLRRSWMKRSSSNCLRVSIWRLSPRHGDPWLDAETKHERTLYVPYVFRNHLIWGEELEGP